MKRNKAINISLFLLVFLSMQLLYQKGKYALAENDSWSPISTTNFPGQRQGSTAVWTGNELIVFGGSTGFGAVNTGYRYDPINNKLTPLSTVGAPSPRRYQSALWTGNVMIIWGGEAGNSGPTYNTGAIYNPSTDTWTPMSTVNAPVARYLHAAVWTGEDMIVWGGDLVSPSVNPTDTGGIYNLATNSWRSLPTDGAPSPRTLPHGIWTGTKLLIFGGAPDYNSTSNFLDTGAIYNPQTNSWSPISTSGAPEGLASSTVVWTGNEMIVYGGYTTGGVLVNSGRKYNPLTDEWSPISTNGALSPRTQMSSVWTGTDLILWGGSDGSNKLRDGALYNPVMNTWESMTEINAPSARSGAKAIWTGNKLILWGGTDASEALLSDGAIYSYSQDFSPNITAWTDGDFPEGTLQQCQQIFPVVLCSTEVDAHLVVRVYEHNNILPIPNAQVVLMPDYIYLGETNSQGILTAKLPVNLPPREETRTSTLRVLQNDVVIGSLPITLYESKLIKEKSVALTKDEADVYDQDFFFRNSALISLICGKFPSPDLIPPGAAYFCQAISMPFKLLGLALKDHSYIPQDGDSLIETIYSYEAPPIPKAYAIYRRVERDGEVFNPEVYWSENVGDFNSMINRKVLIMKASSPIAFQITSPDGKTAGYDVSTQQISYEFPMLISEIGDEPYKMMIPEPIDGNYQLKVIGVGTGPYTLTISTIDSNGNSSEDQVFTGSVTPDVIIKYNIDYSEDSISVNQQPSVTTKNFYTVNEGGVIHLSAVGVDPDGDQLTYSWDLNNDGTFETPGQSVNFAAGDRDGPASLTVKVQAADPGGLTATDQATIQIVNVAPTASLTVTPTELDEGQATVLTFSDQYDPSAGDTSTGFLYAYDCNGDGIFEVDYSSEYTHTCLYPDNGSFSPAGRIKDKDGGFNEYTTTVTVHNLPPVVGSITAPLDPVSLGTQITASADFTDAGVLDTHTAVWDWGDGTTSSGTVTETGGSGSVSDTHDYTVPGVYTIQLTITDKDGDSGTSVLQYVVVYDPAGGFMTGGGWIESPAGAYTPDPSLTGKATFGFVAKYQKGANVPGGNTEFQFKAGDLNFHSTSYDWLVVAGAKAMFKGVGTINGGGNYKFMISAIDGQISGGGGTDKFRIKIWEEVNGVENVIYDNQIGTDEDADPTTALGGGSIVIHN